MRTLFAVLLLSTSALAHEPQVHRDLAYAQPKNERQTLDVYAPGQGKNHPIVLWIHGGGWQVGEKSDVQVKPQAFVERGFVFVSTNYRLLPNATIKNMAGDIAKSIRWVYDHAPEYGGDPNTFFVMGHSAGAQLAALVCTDDRYLKAEKLSLSILKGCVPVDGDTYDVPMQIATVEQRRKDAYRFKFGDETCQVDLSPVTHVAKGKGISPFLILHVAGHPETTAQSQRLVKALQEAGVPARAYPAKDKSHGTINSDLGKPGDEPTRELFRFVRGCLAMIPLPIHPSRRSYFTQFQLDEDPISEGGEWINGGKEGIDWYNVITQERSRLWSREPRSLHRSDRIAHRNMGKEPDREGEGVQQEPDGEVLPGSRDPSAEHSVTAPLHWLRGVLAMSKDPECLRRNREMEREGR